MLILMGWHAHMQGTAEIGATHFLQPMPNAPDVKPIHVSTALAEHGISLNIEGHMNKKVPT
jgi:hypothetical protein